MIRGADSWYISFAQYESKEVWLELWGNNEKKMKRMKYEKKKVRIFIYLFHGSYPLKQLLRFFTSSKAR